MRLVNLLLLWAILPAHAAPLFLPEGVIDAPTPQRLSVCHAHDCKEIVTLAFSDELWRGLTSLFAPPPTDAAEERRRIAEAIGRIERFVGPLTGTAGDRGGSFTGLGAGGQMDCIDESTNTTTYLTLLAGAGLLRHHRVEPRATRGFFLFGWPHTSAVIRETGTERAFAVDSWFHDNGVPPEIVPLERWRDGYDPGKAKAQ